MNEATRLIDLLVNVNYMATKWLMWSETNLPNHSVYVPSIFQLRDAEAHLINMFAWGIENGTIKPSFHSEYDLFFDASETIHQLHEAIVHTARAFFDCADYITFEIDEEVKITPNVGWAFAYKSRIRPFRKEIDAIRQAKSETLETTYANIKRWDRILQVLSTIYLGADYDESFQKAFSLAKGKVKTIESKYPYELIIRHMPSFYKFKVDLFSISKEFKKGSLDLNVLIGEQLADLESEQEKIISEIKERARKAINYLDDFDSLERALETSNAIYNFSASREKIFNVFQTMGSTLASLLMTIFFGEYFKIVPANSNAGIDWGSWMFYAVIAIASFVCVWVAVSLVRKLWLKYKIKQKK